MMTPEHYEAEIDRLGSALSLMTGAVELALRRLDARQSMIDEARYLLDAATNLLDKEEVDDRWELQSEISKFFEATD